MDTDRLVTLAIGFAIGWVGIKAWRHWRHRRKD
jgi:hypothetical protein